MNHNNRTIVPGNSIPLSTKLAYLVGRTPALFLQQLHYWLQKSKHVVNGVKWIYNTLREWGQQLGLSTATIKRTIALLQDLGIIRIERRRQSEWDQTNWYTIDYQRLEALIFQSGSFCTNGEEQVEPIEKVTLSHSYTEISTKTKSTTDKPTHHPLVVRTNKNGILEEDEQEDVLSTSTDKESTFNCPQLSEASDLENDQSSAGDDQAILKEVEKAIAPVPLTHHLKQLVLNSAIEIVRNALEALREAQGQGRVKNSVGYMVRAIEGRWQPGITREAGKTPADFNQWFDAAKKAGLAIASCFESGVLQILTSSDEWILWDEIKARYPLKQLGIELI